MYSIEDYTERSFVVRITDTRDNVFKEIESLLVQKGGLVNNKLRGGYGIVFHISKRQMIEKFLIEYNKGTSGTTELKTTTPKVEGVKVYNSSVWSISQDEFLMLVRRIEFLENEIKQ